MEIKHLDISNIQVVSKAINDLFSEIEITIEQRANVLLNLVSRNLAESCSSTNCIYMPASRTGIMQSHRAIAGALAEQASVAKNEASTIPTLSGTTADFLQKISVIGPQGKSDADLSTLATRMENDVLRGSIEIDIAHANQNPHFLYRQNGITIPLQYSSSMVSELAPVVLFTRHYAKKGDLFIIEEPEAHLHPEAQRQIATTIAQLVAAGINTIVTTHSDYFIEQIANHVRSSKLEGEQGCTPALSETDVSAYMFNRQSNGTIVERLHFDQENGFAARDHDQVSSDQYNETVRLLDQLDGLQSE